MIPDVPVTFQGFQLIAGKACRAIFANRIRLEVWATSGSLRKGYSVSALNMSFDKHQANTDINQAGLFKGIFIVDLAKIIIKSRILRYS